MREAGIGILTAIFIFILIVGAIFALLFYFDVIAYLIGVLTLICVIGLIIGVIIFGIVIIFALFYYMAAKSPEVQEHASYSLDETIDSKEFYKKP